MVRSFQYAYDIVILGYDVRLSKLDWNVNWGESQSNLAYGVEN